MPIWSALTDVEDCAEKAAGRPGCPESPASRPNQAIAAGVLSVGHGRHKQDFRCQGGDGGGDDVAIARGGVRELSPDSRRGKVGTRFVPDGNHLKVASVDASRFPARDHRREPACGGRCFAHNGRCCLWESRAWKESSNGRSGKRDGRYGACARGFVNYGAGTRRRYGEDVRDQDILGQRGI